MRVSQMQIVAFTNMEGDPEGYFIYNIYDVCSLTDISLL